MRKRRQLIAGLAVLAIGVTLIGGCDATLLFNRSLVNQYTGSIYPLTPGDRSGFILVRGNNSTSLAVEFLVTVERRVPSENDPNTFEIATENVRLFAPADQRANDLGVLIDCPAVRIGLGEDLNRPTTSPGVFVGAEEVGVGGIGVPANVNPLDADAGNFDCGDTIIFQAVEANSTTGGVVVRSYVLNDEAFTTTVQGSDTFVNARTVLEENSFDDE